MQREVLRPVVVIHVIAIGRVHEALAVHSHLLELVVRVIPAEARVVVCMIQPDLPVAHLERGVG